MKKTFNSILICCIMALVLTFSLASCNKSCDHVYDDCADIECNLCGETRDSMHSWKDADCVTPKTCTVCQKTEGSALGHEWTTPDVDQCEVQSTCSRCGETEGQNKEHTYDNACDGVCNECNETRLVQHDYSVLQSDETHHWYACPVCERPDGENKAKHVYDNDCDTTCNTCTKTRTTEHTPNADDGDCTTAITCSVCGDVTTEARNEHTGGTATCAGKATCLNCGTLYSEINPNNHDLTTVDDNGACVCGETMVASVGMKAFPTFGEALEAWTDGTTLTLLSDVLGLTEYIETFAKGLILDLNGYKIECSDPSRTIWVDGASGSELTIRDSKGGGYIEGMIYAVGTGKGTSTLRLESGTLEVVMANGNFIMTGGTIRNMGGSALFSNGDNEIMISGGEVHGADSGISSSYDAKITITGTAKIIGAGYCAVRASNVVISGTPTLSGNKHELELYGKITLNTQPADGQKWRVKIDTAEITDGVFAISGDGVTLDPMKFASAMDGYEVKKNDKGELLLCNHSVSYYGVSNGDGTHNTTCWCGGTVLETNLSCSGGMATDTILASCQYCGAAYGELDPNVHYDIYTANMTAEEFQSALTELLLEGKSEISIFLADADTKVLAAIDAALNSSGVDKDSIKLTFGSQITVQNENQLITALRKGGIITLMADITLPPQVYVTKNTILILNSHTLTPGVNGFGVEDGYTLTVIGDGTVNGDEGLWVFGGTLNLKGGIVDCLYVNEIVGIANISGGEVTTLIVDWDSTANISGGKITSLTVYEGGTANIFSGEVITLIVDDEDGTANISGGYVGELAYYEGTLIITGGTFGFDPSAYLAEGYTATEAEGKWTVTKTTK